MEVTTGRLLDNQVNGDWNGEKYSLQEGSYLYTCVYMYSANSNKLRLGHSLVNDAHLFSRRYTAAVRGNFTDSRSVNVVYVIRVL